MSGAIVATFEDFATAQITPDSTLGAESSVVTPNVDIKSISSDQIDGGATRGANLFHSFEQFNVDAGRGAYFTNPAGIENILSRVTGASRSNIFGRLGVLGSANLFLINPNGVIFGSNSSLDVSGSFVTTSANAIGFGNQGSFSASEPNVPPLLTVNPSAFLFNQIAGSITNQSVTGLRVPEGRSLLLLGGNVSLDGGVVRAPGGRVELGGLAESGTVGLQIDGNNLGLSFPDIGQRADVFLRDSAEVNVRAGNGGSIAINAQNLNIAGRSRLRVGIGSGLGSPTSKAGNIDINAQGAINLDSSFISNWVLARGVGKAGDINVTTRSLELTNGAQLSASTFGRGDAGSVNITARDRVSFDGGDAFSVVESGAVGNGGSINIQAGSLSLSLTDGAQLLTIVRRAVDGKLAGQGNAGNVFIDVRGAVTIAGFSEENGNRFYSGVRSLVDSGATGNGGDITISSGSLSVTDGVQLAASTLGQGNAGSVNITARDRVSFDGSTAFSTVESGAVGNGGSINIEAESLSVTNGALLSASSAGSGAAGNIEVVASSIRLDNQASLSSDTTAGQGNIFLRSQNLVLRRGSNITTNATGTATGGNITIDTGVIAALENSDISANAQEASGGRIIINARGIFGTEFRNQPTPESDITASSNLGPEFSGIVELNTPDVDLNQGLILLPVELINTSDFIANSCIARRGRQKSSFNITGTGGFPMRPGDAYSSPFPTGTVRSIPSSGASSDPPPLTRKREFCQWSEVSGWWSRNLHAAHKQTGYQTEARNN